MDGIHLTSLPQAVLLHRDPALSRWLAMDT